MYEIGTAAGHRDLLEKLHTFLTATGSSYGLTYAGTGNGTLTDYRGGSASVTEVITITALSSTTFSVVGSVSGALADATVGTPYTGTKVQFTLTAGSVAFVANDVFTLSISQKWTSRRHCRGCAVTASSGTSGQYSCENVIDGKLVHDSIREWVGGSAPEWLAFTFPANLTIVEYEILGPYTGSYAPQQWTFEYYDGGDWVVLDAQAGVTGWMTGQVRTYAIAVPVSASQYRLNMSVGNTSTTLHVGAVRLRTVAAGVDEACSQYIWEGAGNDGLSEIIIGAHALERGDVDYYDIELCAFTGYEAALPFYQQPGYHGRLWIPLINSSIPYWFVADGRRVVVIAKVGTQYESGYLGFLEPYFTPQQVPYPIALGGSLTMSSEDGLVLWNDVNLRYSNSTNYHRAFTHSDVNSWSYLYAATARARQLGGTWAAFFASSSDNFTNPSITRGWLWPLSQGMTNMDVCADGSYALFPVVLSGATPNHWGQFSGVAVLTGQGLSAETLVRVGEVDWLVVPNINRTDLNDFFAVRLD